MIAGLGVGLITGAYPAAAPRARARRPSSRARSASSPRPRSPAPPSAASPSPISPNEHLQYRLQPWTSYRDRAAVRARQRRHPRWTAGCSRDARELADHARHPDRLRGRQAGSASSSPPGSPRRLRLGARRLTISWPVLAAGAIVSGIGFTVSLLISSIALHGRAARRGQARRARRRDRRAAARRSPFRADRHAAGDGARPPDRRHRRGDRSTSPTTSIPSATTSAGRTTRR